MPPNSRSMPSSRALHQAARWPSWLQMMKPNAASEVPRSRPGSLRSTNRNGIASPAGSSMPTATFAVTGAAQRSQVEFATTFGSSRPVGRSNSRTAQEPASESTIEPGAPFTAGIIERPRSSSCSTVVTCASSGSVVVSRDSTCSPSERSASATAKPTTRTIAARMRRSRPFTECWL